MFAEAEAIEYEQGQPRLAASMYARLAAAGAPAVRAGALLRLARVHRKLGRREEAAEAYRQLAEIRDARLLGVPPEIVARHALCSLGRGDPPALRRGLLAGRWRLSRGQFDYYWSEAARLTGNPAPPPSGDVALASAAAQLWKSWPAGLDGQQGQAATSAGQHPFVVIWRGGPERRTALLLPTHALLAEAAAGEPFDCALYGADGRLLMGRRGAGRPAVRPAADFDLPWTLSVSARTADADAGFAARRRFLALGIALVLLFLITGTWFTAAAIRKEIEVSRLQSEFVAAVSHEFRSPLTSLRQFSEILADGRVPSEERRQIYYQTLLRETARLQRLVESLLTFGRLEAGAGPRRVETVNLADLAAEVVAGFSSDLAQSGGSISTGGPPDCTVTADSETLGVALRNLIDNGLKYSPGKREVRVEWGAAQDRVYLSVRDCGAGIPASERKAIFRKFVRGSVARAYNIKGTGVGLAMVHRIVAAHSGEIRLESEPGKGSTFTILLPRETPS